MPKYPLYIRQQELGIELTGIFQPIERIGELGGNRTRDNLIKSQVLYRLSYELSPCGASAPK